MERRLIQGLYSKEYEHPLDRTTLETLKAIPLFPKLLELINSPYNSLKRVELLGSYLRVNERQLPSVYKIFKEACVILEVEEPGFYIVSSSELNAFTAFSDKPIVCINGSLLDILDDDELMFVIGHELAHIKSAHLLYKTVGYVIKQGILSTVLSTIPGIGTLSSAATIPLNYAYYEWSRAAEYTCDRGGYLACQNFKASCMALMKIAGSSSRHVAELNLDEFMEQSREFKNMDSSTLGNIQKIILNYGSTHPWTVSRVHELRNFNESGAYSDILQRKIEIKTNEDLNESKSVTTKVAVTNKLGNALDITGSKLSSFSKKLQGKTQNNCVDVEQEQDLINHNTKLGNTCKKCNSSLQTEAAFCHKCGTRQ